MTEDTVYDDYTAPRHRKPMLSNRSYDILKTTVTIALPGLGALYFALASIWGLPHGEEVVGSITAVTVFLGLFLRGSTKSYNKSEAKYDGFIDIEQDVMNEKKTFSLILNDSDPYELEKKDEVMFKVNKIE